MKKTNLILIIIGAVLIIVPYFFSQYSIFRLISLLVGIIILLIGLIIHTKHLIIKIVFFPIAILLSTYLVDYYSYLLFDNIPMYTIGFTSSQKVKTYNSLFYRIYDCNGKLIKDKNYEKSYVCDNNDIKTIFVNTFLENPYESYKENENRFVHLRGKITKIIGNTSLELHAYDEKVDINGYVVFDEEKKIVLDDLNIDPTKYYIYDVIEVVGRVSYYLTNDEKVEVHLKDVRIIDLSLYDNYELLINENNSNEKVMKEEGIYYKGIETIFYKYDENNIYELDYLLKDKRESVKNIVKNTEKKMTENEDEVYELEDYSLVICKNDDLIFVNKYLKIDDNICKKK